MTEYTDPPGIPADERMTDAEFRVVREHLGLNVEWLAAHLGVSDRTIRHWESGRYAIPDGVRLAMEGMEQETTEFVGNAVRALLSSNDTDLTVVTYRTDADFHTAHPNADWPASWHRAVVARVAQEVPALAIVYAPTPGGRPS
ncbi:DUF1870 family protein [Micromonospora tulbaghiae]|uniref:helix-turn-helix domain-containing protein n=1 Tax=Micromonospora tulbaghiae TaxID=479978 RepID=UPI0033BB7BFB